MRLTAWTLLAYSAPAFSWAMVNGPVNVVLQGVYGKYFGLPLTSIAAVVFVSRTFDAVTDPLIGYASDRFSSPWGRRKPWILMGAILAAIACWYLYAPSGHVTVTYFLLWYMLAYLAWTISEIPHRAWLAELSPSNDERVRIAASRTIAIYLGVMAFGALPFLPIFDTAEFTPAALRLLAILAVIALPVAAVIACLYVPDKKKDETNITPSPWQAFPLLFRNRPFRIFLLIIALGALASGMSMSVMFFFIDNHLGLGSALAAIIVLAAPAGLLAAPMWSRLARRYGKQSAWAMGYSALFLLHMMLLLLPADRTSASWLIGIFFAWFAAGAVAQIVPLALLANIVDYGRWRFGGDLSASYFAFQMMIEKMVTGLGTALGLGVAGWLGYNPQIAEQTGRGTLGLLVAFPVIPGLLFLSAIPLIMRFPLNEERQAVVIQALARREAA